MEQILDIILTEIPCGKITDRDISITREIYIKNRPLGDISRGYNLNVKQVTRIGFKTMQYYLKALKLILNKKAGIASLHDVKAQVKLLMKENLEPLMIENKELKAKIKNLTNQIKKSNHG